jgi:hypothetical protein
MFKKPPLKKCIFEEFSYKKYLSIQVALLRMKE